MTRYSRNRRNRRPAQQPTALHIITAASEYATACGAQAPSSATMPVRFISGYYQKWIENGKPQGDRMDSVCIPCIDAAKPELEDEHKPTGEYTCSHCDAPAPRGYCSRGCSPYSRRDDGYDYASAGFNSDDQ